MQQYIISTCCHHTYREAEKAQVRNCCAHLRPMTAMLFRPLPDNLGGMQTYEIPQAGKAIPFAGRVTIFHPPQQADIFRAVEIRRVTLVQIFEVL